MLTSIRGLLAATALTGAALVAAPAMAQEVPSTALDQADSSSSGISISGNAAITSDYRFRGVSLSGGDPAIQGGIDLGHDSGFYVGTWGSSIDGGAYGSIELDVYAGYGADLAPGVSFDVGILYYMYPNGVGGADLDYWEPYASISTSFGPAEVTFGGAYAWKQDSLGGDDNLYVYTDASFGIPESPVSISAHLGYTDGSLAPALLSGLSTDDSGFDYSIGISATLLGSLEASLMYVDTEGPSVDGFTDDAIVATLGVSF